jgi:hypothetical protein
MTESTIDWGTLAVYTCSKSCDSSVPDRPVPEFLWVQAEVEVNLREKPLEEGEGDEEDSAQ